MTDILTRLLDSSPNESSHELYCRCLDAGEALQLANENNANLLAQFKIVRLNISIFESALRNAAGLLDEAAEDVADWGLYASQYFQDKHGLDTDVKKYKEAAFLVRVLLTPTKA